MSPLAQGKPARSKRTVVFVAFETEFARAGGLGAVMQVLPKRMAQHEECFALGPHFKHLTDLDELVRLGRIEAFSTLPSFHLSIGGTTHTVEMVEITDRVGFKTYLLSSEGFFTARVDPYVNPRNPTSSMDPYTNPIVPERLTADALFFCAAVPKALAQLGKTRDLVLQLQDWETACVVQAVKTEPNIQSVACVFALHNPYDRYLGHKPMLVSNLMSYLNLCDDNVLSQMIPLMDGPLSTVSKNFARELTNDRLLSYVFADHLQHLFASKGVVGIDNGLFGNKVFPFSSQAERRAKQDDFQGIQREKWERRRKLAEVIEQYQRELAQSPDPDKRAWGADLGLSNPRLPVFLVMGRDDPRQKGFDIVSEAIRRIPKGTARYIFTPMPGAEGLTGLQFLKKLARDRPGEVKVFPFRISSAAFRVLQNGSSYMVMSSLYEPFGAATEAYLAGMPVVARATGGLVQQVVPCSSVSLSQYGRQLVASFHREGAAPTGFLFRELSTPDDVKGWRAIVDCAYWNQDPKGDRVDDDRKGIALFEAMVQGAAQAMQAAIDLYISDQAKYSEMIYNGFRMLDNFSWDRAVQEYRHLYDQVCDP
jgi:glycogen synthase